MPLSPRCLPATPAWAAERKRRVFLVSNCGTDLVRELERRIFALGGEVTDLVGTFDATHLVVPYFRATPKMLAALAAGIWIVQTSYVLHSYDIGCWKHEADYEIGSEACIYSCPPGYDTIPYHKDLEASPRMCRELALVRNRPNFANWKVGLLVNKNLILESTERVDAYRVLQAGGARIALFTSPIDANRANWPDWPVDFAVVLVDDPVAVTELERRGILCVCKSFIKEYLLKYPPPDIQKYRFYGWKQKDRCSVETAKASMNILNEDRSCLKNGGYQVISWDFKMFNPLKECSIDHIGDLISKSCSWRDGSKREISLSKRMPYSKRRRLSSHESKNLRAICQQNVVESDAVFPLGWSPPEHLDDKKSLVLYGSTRNHERRGEGTFGPEVITISSDEESDVTAECIDSVNSVCMKSCKKKDIEFMYGSTRNHERRGEGTFTPEVIISSDEESDVIAESNDSVNSVCMERCNKKDTECIVLSDEKEDLCSKTHHIVDLTCDNYYGLDDTGVNVYKLKWNSVKRKESSSDHHIKDTHQNNYRHYQISSPQQEIIGDKKLNWRKTLKKNNVQIKRKISSKIIDASSIPEENDKNYYGTRLFSSQHSLSQKIAESKSDEKFVDTIVCGNNFKANINCAYDSFEALTCNVVVSKETSLPSIPLICRDNIEAGVTGAHLSINSSENNSNERTDSTLQCNEHTEIISECNSKERSLEMNAHCNDFESNINVASYSFEDKSGNPSVSNKMCVPSVSFMCKDNVKTGVSDTNLSIYSCKNESNEETVHELSSNNSHSSNKENYSSCEHTARQECFANSKIKEEEFVTCGGSNNDSLLKPDALHVCQVQAEVLLSKFYQPWIDLNSHYVSNCCFGDHGKCSSLHGRKKKIFETADFKDENLVLEMESGSCAINFLQSRLDFDSYPSPRSVQYVLLCCMNLWKEGVNDALQWLHQLLHEHPPCASGMFRYYKEILFDSIPKMNAPGGVFWFCMEKIEEILNETGPKTDPNHTLLKSVDSFQNLEESFKSSCVISREEFQCSDKLQHLLSTFAFLISIMEADMNVALINNVPRGESSRYLIAEAFWVNKRNVGTLNGECKHLLSMYFKISLSQNIEADNYQCFQRLLSLMAGVISSSEHNTEPPKYPNIDAKCNLFADAFASEVMNREITLNKASIILSSLKPDWLRFWVCLKLLGMLCGRMFESSLQPLTDLLKNLCALQLLPPSEEEIATIILGAAESCEMSNMKEDCEEMPEKFIKRALKKDQKGETRLHIACRRNQISEVKKLLKVPNININEKDYNGWTPLHEAVYHGSLECIIELLHFKTPSGAAAIDLRVKNAGGITPLMDAVVRNHVKIAKILLEYGGQDLLLDVSNEGISALDCARTEEMMKLLNQPTEWNIRNELSSIPRNLYVKLCVLTPLAIVFYLKFSEVITIKNCIKDNAILTRENAPMFKFQPLVFQRDYKEYTHLRNYLREALKTGNSSFIKTLAFAV